MELPQTYVLAEQINGSLVEDVLSDVAKDASKHACVWFFDGQNKCSYAMLDLEITRACPGMSSSCS